MLGPESKLKGADLSDLTVSTFDLSGSNMKNAILNRTVAKETKFKNSNLEEADFSSAVLTDAKFSGANLNKANFSTAKDVNVSGAYCNEETKFGSSGSRAFQVTFQIEGNFLTDGFIIPIIDIVPGWSVNPGASANANKCCFPGAGTPLITIGNCN